MTLPFPHEEHPDLGSTAQRLEPLILPKGVKATPVFHTYWFFAAERQRIFFERLNNRKYPWTQDPILATHKFTNAYRASDRVSQYLINKVIYSGDQNPIELVFRILLFKFFNKIETWELLERQLGCLSYQNFDFSSFDRVLTQALEEKKRIYSAAYIMPTGGVTDRKHRTHLRLLETMMKNSLPQRLQNMNSLREVFELLRAYPTIGDFLAYQYAIDLNYSCFLNFSEMEFIVPGPGATDGIRKCFRDAGNLLPSDLIRFVAETQQEQFQKLQINFQNLWGRPLQLIDCQNLFCEVDKYARYAHPEIKGKTGRTRIKQKFRPNMSKLEYFYPPKWSINNLIGSTTKACTA
ncbi:MAG TPA: nucleotide kinase domain-containing protein [Candidatus Angelobacter sp.]|jgi:hypothetical protein|nr:nucleotide kinase domain-containing protein [Candidatus Angelobacter sp.]